jgi:opacity protein-like surface antigen
MNRHRLIFASLLTISSVILSATAPLAQSDANGGYSGAFYQVPLGARATAMGGAYRSIADDGSGPLYNPAGVCSLRKPLFGTAYRAMHLDRTLGYVTGLVPIRDEAVLGGTYLYSSSGKVEGRDSDGDVTGLDFSFNNHDIGIVFAKRFENYFAMGVRMSYLYARFVDMSTASVNVDLGAMLYINQLMGREEGALFPVQDIQVGLVFKHLDTKYKWNNEQYVLKHVSASDVGNDQIDKVPMEAGVGVSGKFLASKLLIAADITKSQNQSMLLAAGTEYILAPQLALRAGFGGKRFTAGTGYLFNFGTNKLGIDYAFSSDKVNEGSEHMFSIDLQF